MKYSSIDNNLFIANRNNLRKHLKPNSIAIFHSNDEMPRSGDGNFHFRQNADLFYLSGIDQERSVLVIFPDCPNEAYREALFLRKTNDQIKVWEGHKYTQAEATASSGIKHVYWLEDFDNVCEMLVNYAETVYLNLNENYRLATEVPYRDLRMAQALQAKHPLHKYERLGPIMAALRAIKSDIEIAQIQEAVNITHKAFRRVMGFVKPGVMEYEIEAEIIHEFIRNRANGHAYEPIIASGESATILHYTDNNQPCKEGDVILMDFGAEYANYAADLTRCIPVSGKFTKRQREVYDAVLHVMREATKMLTVGNTLDKLNEGVGKVMEQQLIKLGLLNADDVAKQDPKKPLYKKYFMHGTSHFLGLDVHDIGDRSQPLKAGMVFTCEPGIYIPDENLGIRLENDILITEKGPKDLMAHIPLDADDIEAFMANARAGQLVS